MIRQYVLRVALVMCVFVVVVGIAVGQPDVIVGDLTGPSNYTADATHDAFAIGTTSCNIGTSNLTWQANNNQHPVIGQNLYRYDSSGRFMMVGQSWLKHGFGALQNSLCQTCTGSGNWQALGVGCSDPYGASLNGQQNGLGPKSEVNASTGYFPYPYTNHTSSIPNYRRLRVPLSLLNTTDTFITEAQYIQPEDATAGNDNNNASYRMTSMTGSASNYSLSHSGPTVREQPAINAWAVLDPGVLLQVVDVPGADGGRFTVGLKRTDNGNGTWHFEYAVHNLNCHDSAGSFSVTFGSGVTITGTGFHAPEYHSGEPVDNGTWSASTASNGVTWMHPVAGAGLEDNMLRWGSMYSFWFDSSDPSPTGANIGLYRSGGSASVPAPPFPSEAWQVNQTDASLDIDGLTNDPFIGPIVANMAIGSFHTLNLSGLPGGYFDLFITPSAGVPAYFTTPAGQIVNLDLSDPLLLPLYGTPIPMPGGGISTMFAPTGPFALTAQMLMFNPGHPDGISLSACLEATAANNPTIVVECVGDNSYNSISTSGFWRITHSGAPVGILSVKLDFSSATPGSAAVGDFFDTDQTGMSGVFNQGSSYRNNSAVTAGLDMAASNPYPGSGFTGTNSLGGANFATIAFAFAGGLFENMTFEFDADTDPGTQGATDHEGTAVTVTLVGGQVLSGNLAVDGGTPNRVFVQFN
ncbi:MAG: hypothetical protein CMJ83_13020 [Planctomycetes bacterium]|nr:hypothetical protein [Planctomycetota bacterium]